MHLTVLVPSVTVWNVWDLPLYAWRWYADYVDQVEARNREEARKHG